MTQRSDHHIAVIARWCALALSTLGIALACTSCGPLVSLDEQDIDSARVLARSSPSEGGALAEYPVDLTDVSKRAELATLMSSLETDEWGGCEGLYLISLEIRLHDGREYHVIWWDDDHLELLILSDDEDRGGDRTGVVSPEMTAFLSQYMQYR